MLTDSFTHGFGRVRRFVCGLHGHDALLHFEAGRMSLRCTSCDYETPGWDLRGTLPPVSVAQVTPRQTHAPLLHEPRAA